MAWQEAGQRHYSENTLKLASHRIKKKMCMFVFYFLASFSHRDQRSFVASISQQPKPPHDPPH